MAKAHPSTSDKALALNLDQSVYGTIAEIGGGQEVARTFFRVGAASGTVAKTMSAYDMKVSDDIYGTVKRYVSRERLEGMLAHEYKLIIQRLDEGRGEISRFFSFADTVAIRNFKGTNECHGWMGIRFQLEPRSEPNDIILHVNMLDPAAVLQQQALGIVGVNVIYGAFTFANDPEQLILSLADDIGTERIEVDAIEVRGPAFKDVDRRELVLFLLEKGFTNAVLFDGDGPCIPSEEFHGKPVFVQRGSFRPVTHVNADMMTSGLRQFCDDHSFEPDSAISVWEMTLQNLLLRNLKGKKTLLAIADSLLALGHRVLITDYLEYFRLSSYLRRFTRDPIGMVLGPNNLYYVFQSQFYEGLDGGILEAFGRLFRNGVNLYIYPMRGDVFASCLENRKIDSSKLTIESDELVTADNLYVEYHQRLLYRYLRELGVLRPVREFNTEVLKIHSSHVREAIGKSDADWENSVPDESAKVIKKQKLFTGS